jgi:AraC-like DNA-binding protein
VGFADPERMRRAFLRVFGQPPQALRRVARVGEAGDRISHGQAEIVGPALTGRDQSLR